MAGRPYASIGDYVRVLVWGSTPLIHLLSYRGLEKLGGSLERCHIDAVRLQKWGRKARAYCDERARCSDTVTATSDAESNDINYLSDKPPAL